MQAGRRARVWQLGHHCFGNCFVQRWKITTPVSKESPAMKQLNPAYATFCTALLGSLKIKEISTGTQKRAWELEVGALDTRNLVHPGCGCALGRLGAQGLSIKSLVTHTVQLKGITCHEMPGSASKTDKIPAVTGRRQLAVLSGRQQTRNR